MLNREDYLKEFAKDKNIVNLVKNNQLTKEDINNNFSVLLAYYLKKKNAKCARKWIIVHKQARVINLN